MVKIAITGGGTFGQIVSKAALSKSYVESVTIIDHNEATLARMTNDPEFKSARSKIALGDVTQRDSLYTTFPGHDVVIHSAALKHVPLCEEKPSLCIETNVNGSLSVLKAAADSGVKRVVLVSTDKAAQPMNTYGQSKALMEALGREYDGYRGMEVNIVRFGNFIVSNGAVVELFLRQARTGTIQLTSAEMTRYFIRHSQIATTALFASTCERHGVTLVPQMRAATMGVVAKAAAQIEAGSRSTPLFIKTTGPRPGERMHEVLIGPQEVNRTFEVNEFLGYAIQKEALPTDKQTLKEPLVSNTAQQMDVDEVVGMIHEALPTLSEALK